MGYLKTILTYNVPSEAEVDRTFLESHGIAVCLLNANTSRNELGAPFFVRLQVMEENAERARGLIKQANPQRFGSSERVNEIDRQIKRALARIACVGIPVGIAVGLAAYFLTADPAHARPIRVRGSWIVPDFRLELSILAGFAASIGATMWINRKRD